MPRPSRSPAVRAGAVSLALVAVAALGGCGSDGTTADPRASAAEASASPSASPEVAPSASATPSPPATATSSPSAGTEAAVPREAVVPPEDDVVRLTASYEGGQVVGGVQTVDVPLDTEVVITVTSDVAEEVHVHGIDIHADVEPGGTVEVPFTADLPGAYEIEMEDSGVLLVTYRVA